MTGGEEYEKSLLAARHDIYIYIYIYIYIWFFVVGPKSEIIFNICKSKKRSVFVLGFFLSFFLSFFFLSFLISFVYVSNLLLSSDSMYVKSSFNGVLNETWTFSCCILNCFQLVMGFWRSLPYFYLSGFTLDSFIPHLLLIFDKLCVYVCVRVCWAYLVFYLQLFFPLCVCECVSWDFIHVYVCVCVW